MSPTQTKPEPTTDRTLPPVMDIRPPKSTDAPKSPESDKSPELPPTEIATRNEPIAESAITQAPKVEPEPASTEPKEPPKEQLKESPTPSSQTVQGPPKLANARPVRKHNGSGVGLAIFATLVVILGLGILMVYAYLRTNGISVL